jgi:hypothetical protein
LEIGKEWEWIVREEDEDFNMYIGVEGGSGGKGV